MPIGSKELRPHRLHIGLFDISGDKLTRRTSVELDVAGALTEVSALAGEKVADLVLINDKDQTYAKLRFDDRSIATMKSHLGGLDDSLAALSGHHCGIHAVMVSFLQLITSRLH